MFVNSFLVKTTTICGKIKKRRQKTQISWIMKMNDDIMIFGAEVNNA